MNKPVVNKPVNSIKRPNINILGISIKSNTVNTSEEPVKKYDPEKINQKRALNKLRDIFNLKNINNYYYSPLYGIKPSCINMHNEFIYEKAKIYFKILDLFNLEYAVFAGQSIGMIRNKRNIPWVDDYDILFFSSQLNKFKNEVKPLLEKNNFRVSTLKFNPNNNIKHIKGINLNNKETFIIFGYQITCKVSESKTFLCDIFIAHKSPIVEGINRDWGAYNKAKIPLTAIYPFVRRKFDKDLILPFFQNIDKEVELSYGCIKSCVIYTHSARWKIHYDRWEEAYEDFNYVKHTSISNMKNLININQEYKPINNLTINKNDNNFEEDFDILKFININNIGKIFIHNNNFLIKYVMTIKYYFPEIIIEFFSYNMDISIVHFLNHVNTYVLPKM